MIKADVYELEDINRIKFRVHHVGCAVKNIEEALKYYIDIMGFTKIDEPFDFSSENIKVCFVDIGNGTLLELIEGTSENSPVKKILERPGGGVYHVCFEVEDLKSAVSYLCANKFLKYRKSEMRNEKYHAIYMITPDDQLVELIELI